jgi:hypothetical protein
VTHTVENGKSILGVSVDFKAADTPAPTWRVVDSQGNIYTLDAFKIKTGKGEKRSGGAVLLARHRESSGVLRLGRSAAGRGELFIGDRLSAINKFFPQGDTSPVQTGTCPIFVSELDGGWTMHEKT